MNATAPAIAPPLNTLAGWALPVLIASFDHTKVATPTPHTKDMMKADTPLLYEEP
jgi:hypothetical protein